MLLLKGKSAHPLPTRPCLPTIQLHRHVCCMHLNQASMPRWVQCTICGGSRGYVRPTVGYMKPDRTTDFLRPSVPLQHSPLSSPTSPLFRTCPHNVNWACFAENLHPRHGARVLTQSLTVLRIHSHPTVLRITPDPPFLFGLPSRLPP